MAEPESVFTIAFCALSTLVSLLSCGYILYRSIRKCTVLHMSCFIGSIFLLVENFIQLLRSTGKAWASDRVICWSYMVLSSLVSILSCYVVLQLGTNFYHAYNIKKYFLLFAPIFLAFVELGMTMFITLKMVFDEDKEPDREFAQINMYIGTSVALFSLIYAVIPLFTIKKDKDLLPEETAVSIMRLFTILAFFFAHLISGLIIIHTEPYMNFKLDNIDHIILSFVFVGCVVPSPRQVIKNIKKRMLGVEEFVIGGHFRRSRAQEMIGPQQQNQAGFDGFDRVTVLKTTEPYSYDDEMEWTQIDINDQKANRSNSTASTVSASSSSGLLPK